MTTPAPDWADEEAGRLTKEYWSGTSGDEISVSAADTSAALRAAYERGKADGRIKGLREAVDICDGNTQPRSEIRARIAELEREADNAK